MSYTMALLCSICCYRGASWWETVWVMRASVRCLLSYLTLDSLLKLETRFSSLLSVSCQKTVLCLSQLFPCVLINNK